jgi:hypothetical protein
MDCIFNKFIPLTDEQKIILRPTSKTFINGMAPSYDTTYPEELRDYISEREYSYMINKIIDELTMMWPCCFCFTFGYMFCLCTIGLSFLLPNCCISEAKIRLQDSIKEANESILKNKNLQLSYHQKCSTSWLQIDKLDKGNFSKSPEMKFFLANNQLLR